MVSQPFLHNLESLITSPCFFSFIYLLIFIMLLQYFLFYIYKWKIGIGVKMESIKYVQLALVKTPQFYHIYYFFPPLLF